MCHLVLKKRLRLFLLFVLIDLHGAENEFNEHHPDQTAWRKLITESKTFTANRSVVDAKYHFGH